MYSVITLRYFLIGFIIILLNLYHPAVVSMARLLNKVALFCNLPTSLLPLPTSNVIQGLIEVGVARGIAGDVTMSPSQQFLINTTSVAADRRIGGSAVEGRKWDR